MAAGNLVVLISAFAAALLAITLFPASDIILSVKRLRITKDLVVKNAVIYTVDASQPFAEAMLVRDGKILRVGNYSSVQDFVGHGVRELDLKGKLVVPGFIDSHVHLIYGGLQMFGVKLGGVKDKKEFLNKVEKAVKGKEKGIWVLGGGWNDELWGGQLPDASWVDAVSPENPVWLSRMDGHMGLANSVALKMAGITKYTTDPVGGSIVRAENGEPTGLLVDSAMQLLSPSIPEISVQERRDALARASKFALMRGVTTVVDMGRYFPGVSPELSWEDLSDVYEWADSGGKMTIRVCLFFPMETWSRLTDLIQRRGQMLSEWIYLGGVKAFADGSLGSNSALFYEPYADEPQNYGLQVTDPDALLNMMLDLDSTKLQVAVHAIGDKANDIILDLYSTINATRGTRDRRFRIEHAQHLSQKAPMLFGQEGVVASVQPDHLLDDAFSAPRKLGEDRAHRGSYLFQSLLSGGAQLAFGSDWPVSDINPLGSMRTAVNRMHPDWEKAWLPSERLKLEDALKAYTASAAYSCFLDHMVGSLSPGKFADFVVLSSNSWQEFKEELSVTVVATYIQGKQVFEVAPCLHMVELTKTGGDTVDFHKFCKTFTTGKSETNL